MFRGTQLVEVAKKWILVLNIIKMFLTAAHIKQAGGEFLSNSALGGCHKYPVVLCIS